MQSADRQRCAVWHDAQDARLCAKRRHRQRVRRWRFDPHEGRKPLGKFRNRGVTYWESGDESRVFFGFQDWLYALDAKTGQPEKTLAPQAALICVRGWIAKTPRHFLSAFRRPASSTANLLIVGSIVSESLPAAPGHIRAYELRTGKLRWIFHTIPLPGEYGYETWPKDAWRYAGGVNDWSGMALDAEARLALCADRFGDL